jgi:PAS domain S-box-containing protein
VDRRATEEYDALEQVTKQMTAALTRCCRDFGASEERLQLAQWPGRIGTFEWNIRTGVNTWTPELEAMYGLPPGGFERTDIAFKNRVHSDDRRRVSELVDMSLKTGQPTDGEWRVVWPDGSIHWVAGRGQVFRNKSGEPIRMLGVNLDIMDRRCAEEARLRYHAVVESSDDAIFSKTADGIITSWNRGAQRIYGYAGAEVVGKPISILMPPELLQEESDILERLRAGEHIEHYETVRVTKARERINISLSISPTKDPEGKIVGFSGIARDISERKLAELTVAEMTRKLVEAQEQERARIGRELHDDITQRLAMLAFELNLLRNKGDLPTEVRDRVEGLQQMTSDISMGVHTLSHELHSSTLEYLGLEKGMRGWCRDYGARRKLKIDFKSHDVPELPQEVSLCLFRVLQEALHNAARHSGANRIEVQLAENSGAVHLIVSDSGKGFDIEAARRSRGLGLTSMQERVRLVGGRIAIDSKSGAGTTIRVCVPFGRTASRNVGRTDGEDRRNAPNAAH